MSGTAYRQRRNNMSTPILRLRDQIFLTIAASVIGYIFAQLEIGT